MELVGEEKRIQALFRELRLEDERITPRFAVVWHRAQSRSFAPRSRFKLSFVAATVLLFCALFSLAWFLRQWQRSQELNSAAVPVVPITSIGIAQTRLNPPSNLAVSSDPKGRSDSKSRLMKLVARRHAELLAARRSAIRNASAISSWQSPTTALLRSPGDAVLTSLPQLNESVNELKSFLPSRSN
jgi:hypothetical protein